MNDDKSPMPVSVGLSVIAAAPPLVERRATWVVLVRVDARAGWCAYGPMTHAEALRFQRRGAGTNIEHQLANLIPLSSVQKLHGSTPER